MLSADNLALVEILLLQDWHSDPWMASNKNVAKVGFILEEIAEENFKLFAV